MAIHTTTELLTGTLLDLAQNNDFIDSLRREMIPVLKEQNTVGNGDAEGAGKTSWKKNSLYKLKLLDSALKESQRLHTRDIGEFTCGRLFAGKTLTQYSKPPCDASLRPQ